MLEREALGREALEREALGREAPEREALEREALGREALGREAPEREALGREARGREALGREALGREALGREARGRGVQKWRDLPFIFNSARPTPAPSPCRYAAARGDLCKYSRQTVARGVTPRVFPVRAGRSSYVFTDPDARLYNRSKC